MATEGKVWRTICRRVDEEFFIDPRAGGVEPLAVNPEKAAVLIFRSPNHNRVTVGIGSDGRRPGL